MRTRTRLAAGTAATVTALGLGAFAAPGAMASAPAPTQPDHKVVKVVDHRNDHERFIFALCHPEHRRHPQVLIRVKSLRELRAIERRFDVECRVVHLPRR